jgi:hypothetical protein
MAETTSVRKARPLRHWSGEIQEAGHKNRLDEIKMRKEVITHVNIEDVFNYRPA